MHACINLRKKKKTLIILFITQQLKKYLTYNYDIHGYIYFSNQQFCTLSEKKIKNKLKRF